MLGFRGASRYYSDRYRDGFALECRALKRARETLGFANILVMIPFCRTPEEADLVLAVHDCTEREDAPALAVPAAAARLEIYNKVDLAPGFSAPAGPHPALRVSAKTGEGIEALREAILQTAGWRSHGESVFLARERHLRALQAAARHLAAAAGQGRQWELFAEELRLAHEALASITGEYTADDLLGEIFSRFCIGK